MRLSRPLFWLAVLLVSGCITLSPYQAPTSGKTAQLFIKADGLSKEPTLFDTFGDAKHCTDTKPLVSSGTGEFDFNTRVTADKDFTVRMRLLGRAGHCIYIATFEPKADRKYYLEPFMTTARCGLLIFDVTSGERVLERSVRKRTHVPSLSGGACDPNSYLDVKKDDQTSLDDLRGLLPRDNKSPSPNNMDDLRGLLPPPDKP